MEITSAEPDGASALVLEILDSPEIVALARDCTDVQIVTVDPDAVTSSWSGPLPQAPAKVVADVRAVRALLGDERGRSWLGAVGELALALPVGADPAALLPTASELEPLGLRADHVDHVTTTLAVVMRRAMGGVAGAALPEQVVAAWARTAAEASAAADVADRARRDGALALALAHAAQQRTDLEHDVERAAWERERLRYERQRARKRDRWRRALRQPLATLGRALNRVRHRLI